MNKIAAAIAAPNTEECLIEIDRLSSMISAAEVRLDLMDSFDLEKIVRSSPVPLVITYRPAREGGQYKGSEEERLSVLKRATELEAAYIDIELDSLPVALKWKKTSTKLMASKHWFHEMPNNFIDIYQDAKNKADVVKLVGTAETTLDALPVIQLLQHADSPVIALAMGTAGQLTRVIGPAFSSCELTYGGASKNTATAPGQLTVEEMVSDLKIDQVNSDTKWRLFLSSQSQWSSTFENNVLTLQVPVIESEIGDLSLRLRQELTEMDISTRR